jgi:hypothetical protein
MGGQHIHLHVGEPPSAQRFGGELSIAYQKEIRALPLLHQQGDGMRSFAACLLFSDVTHYPIILIDEPETFLHPGSSSGFGSASRADDDGPAAFGGQLDQLNSASYACVEVCIERVLDDASEPQHVGDQEVPRITHNARPFAEHTTLGSAFGTKRTRSRAAHSFMAHCSIGLTGSARRLQMAV